MKFHSKDCVQRELHFAIVDEVDSILIDEARTPLIISGPVDYSIKDYENGIDKEIQKVKELIIKDPQTFSRNHYSRFN